MKIERREDAAKILNNTPESMSDEEYRRWARAYGDAIEIARYGETLDGRMGAEDLGIPGGVHWGAQSWDIVEGNEIALEEREARFSIVFNKLIKQE